MKSLSKYDWAAALSVFGYVFVFSTLSYLKYSTFHTTSFDLSIFVQGLWGIRTGHPEISIKHGTTLWQLYLSPLLFPLSLLSTWSLFIPFLLFLQSVCLGMTGWILYKLTLLKSKNGLLALSICVGTLLHPAIQNANLFEFHTLTLSLPFLALFSSYVERKEEIKASWMLILGMMVREEVAAILFLWGVYTFLKGQRRKAAILSVLSVCWIGLSLLLKYEHKETKDVMDSTFQFSGVSVVSFLFSLKKLKVLMGLFLGFGFLSLVGVRRLIWVLIPFLYYYFNPNQKLFIFYFHYLSFFVPFLAWGATEARIKYAWGFILIGSLLSNYLFAYTPWSLKNDYNLFSKDPYALEATEVLSRIEPGRSITASCRILAHVAKREFVDYRLVPGADFVIWDIYPADNFVRNPDEYKRRTAERKDLLKTFLTDYRYKITYQGQELLLLQK